MLSWRVLLGAVALAGIAFLASFAVGRAFRGERRPDLRPPPVVVPAPLGLASFGPPAKVPALKRAAPRPQTKASG